jgi:hypothetical protein
MGKKFRLLLIFGAFISGVLVSLWLVWSNQKFTCNDFTFEGQAIDCDYTYSTEGYTKWNVVLSGVHKDKDLYYLDFERWSDSGKTEKIKESLLLGFASDPRPSLLVYFQNVPELDPANVDIDEHKLLTAKEFADLYWKRFLNRRNAILLVDTKEARVATIYLYTGKAAK